MELIFDQGNSDVLWAQNNNKLVTFRRRPCKTTTYLPSTLDISPSKKNKSYNRHDTSDDPNLYQ
jgi:hypothetical protein